MTYRALLAGSVVAVVAGLLVAIPMTVADWRLNPSNLFHDTQGTQWSVVAETALSWFWPVTFLALIVSVAINVLIARMRAR